MKISGVVFYEGPSRIDGQPIVGIATFNTDNRKTGNLVQTWIMRSDMNPVPAIHTGADESICGNCPLRGAAGEDGINRSRGCYVLIHQAPYQIYESYKKGNYPKLEEKHRIYMMGKGLRYGSYGDPVAIPMKYWDKLQKHCTGKSSPGYTHQWKNRKFQAWSKRVMASTHNLVENELAHKKGWRTFRTVMEGSETVKNEIICPATEEGGYKTNCALCGLCNGSSSNSKKNITVVAHGHGKPKWIKPLTVVA